ncbi:MAG: hypothetical protein Q7R49_04830 [Candidatus Daviesbacteria bacterium]|nr:hypothetical protein [Candidatus Daviesbacteria bacterium]
MESSSDTTELNSTEGMLKPLSSKLGDMNRIFVVILVVAVILGAFTGYSLAGKSSGGTGLGGALPVQSPKSATQDTRTFKDFAEGTLQVIPPAKPGQYVEGTHLLVRKGADPVSLTSSVVDLSQYVGKKVKVYGETQKALKVGWLMDIGRIEEVK